MKVYQRNKYFPGAAKGPRVLRRSASHQAVAAAFLGAALLLGGCQPTPDSEIISQKDDIQNVVGNYTEDEGNVGVPLREQLGAPETVSFEASYDQGSVNFVAREVPVEIPETDGIGAAVISRADFTAEQVQALVEQYFRGNTPYEIVPMTKEDYQRGIGEYQQMINDQKASGGSEEYIASIEGQIQYYQEQMESAPSASEITDTPVDFQWGQDIFHTSSLGISGENDKTDVSYSFLASKYESACHLDMYCFTPDRLMFIEAENAGLAEGTSTVADYKAKLEQYTAQNDCQYTEGEAADLALGFLETAGVNTQGLMVSNISPLLAADRDSGKVLEGIKGYSIVLSHGIGGVPQTFARNTLMYVPETESSSGQNTGKLPYDYESIRVQVGNDGVMDLEWINPMILGEITAERVKLMPFDEILEIMKQQMGYAYEAISMENPEAGERTITVEKITLGLMRIQNKDDEENYTLIPVWDVFRIDDYSGSVDNYSIMTINAMDGSMINRSTGY